MPYAHEQSNRPRSTVRSAVEHLFADQKARRHRFIDDQPPLFRDAGVYEGAGQAVVRRQIFILFEPWHVNKSCHASLHRLILQ
jgi:hypothetical protein